MVAAKAAIANAVRKQERAPQREAAEPDFGTLISV
jgi:hypothetical protein